MSAPDIFLSYNREDQARAKRQLWPYGLVEPFLSFADDAAFRRVIAQQQSVVMFGFPMQDSTFPGRSCNPPSLQAGQGCASAATGEG